MTTLQPILEHIAAEAESRGRQILSEAQAAAAEARRAAEAEAEAERQAILAAEGKRLAAEKQKRLVAARLESRKAVLAAKQGLIDALFAEVKGSLAGRHLKKKRVTPDGVKSVAEDADFFLAQVRQAIETELGPILFP